LPGIFATLKNNLLTFSSGLFKTELAKSANAENALAMKAYMKNEFEFLGIPTPERRKILKHFISVYNINNERELILIVKELWMNAEREFQYCAIDILMKFKKLWSINTIEIIEYCLISKSWWDTVDPLSYDCAGSYFKLNPSKIIEITGKWNRSENMWLKRSSLLFQKSYKDDTNTHILSEYILRLAFSKEFFIQKAIGWILREYAKTNAEWVKKFVSLHKLAILSQREALKHLQL